MMDDDLDLLARSNAKPNVTEDPHQEEVDPVQYLKKLAAQEKIDPDVIQPILNIVQQQTQLSYETYRGSLLPPRALAQYNEIVPGSAERFVQIYADQVTHRQQLERDQFEAIKAAEAIGATRSHDLASRGSWTAVGIVAALLVLAGIAVWQGQAWPAFGIIFTTIAGLVSVFMTNRKK